jgi:CHAD domain-containing protein
MRSTLERELKLDPPDGFVLPALDGDGLPARNFASTYLDTEDLRLARGGVTLRYRVENGSGAWQLKLPREGARVELEREGAPGSAPAELIGLLTAHLRGRKLVRVARMKTRRQTIRTAAGDVVDDAVSVYEGPRIRMRFRELEIELITGDGSGLGELEQTLLAAGAQPSNGAPKVFRAIGFEPPSQLPLRRSTPPLEALGERLHREYLQLLRHDPGVRLADDPEDIHQMRVATRRLRAYLRAARPLVNREWADGLRVELAWLGGSLGAARDLDVLLERLRGDLAAEAVGNTSARGLLKELERGRGTAYAAAAKTLSEPRYLELLDRLEREAHAPVAGASPKTRLRRVFRDELGRCRKTFDRLGRKPTDEALHRARIRVKRARYAAELAEHELGEGADAFLQAAKKLQDVLGEHQDAVVAQERIGAWADAHPEHRDLADRIVALEQSRQAACRAAWPKHWRRLERLGRRL